MYMPKGYYICFRLAQLVDISIIPFHRQHLLFEGYDEEALQENRRDAPADTGHVR